MNGPSFDCEKGVAPALADVTMEIWRQLKAAKAEIERLRAERNGLAVLCMATEEWGNGKIGDDDLRRQIAIFQSDEKPRIVERPTDSR